MMVCPSQRIEETLENARRHGARLARIQCANAVTETTNAVTKMKETKLRTVCISYMMRTYGIVGFWILSYEQFFTRILSSSSNTSEHEYSSCPLSFNNIFRYRYFSSK